jgi:hypothetical protein
VLRFYQKWRNCVTEPTRLHTRAYLRNSNTLSHMFPRTGMHNSCCKLATPLRLIIIYSERGTTVFLLESDEFSSIWFHFFVMFVFTNICLLNSFVFLAYPNDLIHDGVGVSLSPADTPSIAASSKFGENMLCSCSSGLYSGHCNRLWPSGLVWSGEDTLCEGRGDPPPLVEKLLVTLVFPKKTKCIPICMPGSNFIHIVDI